MLLIKLGGSLFSPKHKVNFIDEEYLHHFSSFLTEFDVDQKILVHGTGNIGHGFVRKYGLSLETLFLGRQILDTFFSSLDLFFPGFKRCSAEDVLCNHLSDTISQNIIVGGDISKACSIISSDDVFSYFLTLYNPSVSYLLTDVDGVLDANGDIILEITRESFARVHFRKKDGDVTGSMYNKIAQLFTYSLSPFSSKIVWIINGYDFDNMRSIFTTGIGKGTRIILSHRDF